MHAHKVGGGLLAAMRQPEGEDVHGFDPALIFKRYLVITHPTEEREGGLETPLEGLGLGLDPEGGATLTMPGGQQEEQRLVVAGQVVARVEARGWPSVRAGRNDGRIELETLSSAGLEELIALHEGGVGPALITKLRQLQMGARIREAQAAQAAVA